MFTEVNDYLVNWGIAKNTNKATEALIKFQGERGEVAQPVGAYVRELFRRCTDDTSNSSGAIFEYLIASTLKKLGLTPFAIKCKLKGIPNIEWDICVWDQETNQPIILWLTTTLRERIHTADAQAFRLKSSYPGARLYLVSMDSLDVARRVNYPFESLDGLLYPDSKEFEDLINRLKSIPRSTLSKDHVTAQLDLGTVIC